MSRASRLTRRDFLAGASASVLAGAVPALAMPAFKHGGHPQPSGAVQLSTFDLVEHSGVSSLGYKRIGLPIRQADVPPGHAVEIQIGGVAVPAQFDRRATWKWGSNVGSQQFMTACIRVPSFTANEARTYAVVSKPGSFSNASAMSLATALAGTDFKVDFTSMSGSVAGAMPGHTASLNTHAAVATRVEKYESGPVCDSWLIWGMASSGGVDHAHLKTNWYFTVWKDAGGTIVDYEVAAVIAMDWWSIAGKEKLTYTATLKNGSTVIQAYGGSINSVGVRSATVEHVYRARWATVRLQNDNEHGTRHWINNPRPTLQYKPNRTYWIATGLVPPYDITTAYADVPSFRTGAASSGGVYEAYTYQPGGAQGHTVNVDAPGTEPGRGIITSIDVIGFTQQTAQNVRTMLVNAMAGLHVPYHHVSNNSRTRPGESSDIANTVASLILWDERGQASTPSSFYDFTADGMPTAVHAYYGVLSAGKQDGYVAPTGGFASGSSGWVPGSASHAINYSYMAYLHSGERYYFDAMLGYAMYTVHGLNADGSAALAWSYGNALDGTIIYPGSPHVQWSGIQPRIQANSRSSAWGTNIISSCAVIADDDVQAGFIKQWIGVQAKWLANAAATIPSTIQGIWEYEAGIGTSNWWETFMAQAWYCSYDRTGDANWLPLAEYVMRMLIHYAEIDRMAMIRAYHSSTRLLMLSKMNLSTNPYFDEVFLHDQNIDLVGSTGVFTYSQLGNEADIRVPYAENDLFIMSALNGVLASYAFPAEIPEGTIYYMVNVTGSTFQIATTPSGTPLTFASDYNNFEIAVLSASWQQTVPERNLLLNGPGGYSKAAIALAYRHNHPRLTPTIMAKFNTYYAGANYDYTTTDGKTWNMIPTA